MFKFWIAVVVSIAGSASGFVMTSAHAADDVDFKSLPRIMHLPAHTRERYIQNVLSKFRRSAGEDQVIDPADIELQKRRNSARSRAHHVQRTLSYDLNGDGVVSRKETETALNLNPARLRYQTKQVQRIFKADTNGDGKITLTEMIEHGNAQIQRRHSSRNSTLLLSQLLALDPNGDQRLTVDELEVIARKVFSHYDKDGNSVLSETEMAKWTDDKRQAYRASRPNSTARAAMNCKLPRPGAKAKIILIGAYESGSLSTTSVAGLDRATETSTFYIEPGSDPLYIIASSYTPNIWRFTGNVNRIERLATYPWHQRSNTAGVGVVGLAKDRISFLKAGACGGGFYRANSGKTLQALAILKSALGRQVDKVVAAYTLPGAILPSGTFAMERQQQVVRLSDGSNITLAARGAWPTDHPNARYQIRTDTITQRSLHRFSPGGIVRVNVKNVVVPAKTSPQAYDVLPQQAGLVQLLDEQKMNHLSDGMYLITKPIARFPAGLSGAHSVTFMLGKGIPVPAGNPGHSCVLSQETGKAIPRLGRMCR